MKNLLALSGIEPQFLGRPARSLVTITTELSRQKYGAVFRSYGEINQHAYGFMYERERNFKVDLLYPFRLFGIRLIQFGRFRRYR